MWPFARLAASHPSSLPQAAAWIKSDGIVVDNPELVTARKVCRATYYEPTQQAPLDTYYEPTQQAPLATYYEPPLTISLLTRCRSTYYEPTHQVPLYLL